MKMWMGLLAVASLLVGTATAEKTDLDVANGTLEWVRAQGGLVHEALEWRRRSPDAPLGLFATADIPANTILLRIPDSTLIPVTDEDCLTYVAELVKERQLGAQSEMAPFIELLFHPRNMQIKPPSAWSDAGRALFKKIVAEELNFPDVLEPPDEYVECLEVLEQMDKDQKTGALYSDAFWIANQRSLNDVLTPVLDMIEGRGGSYTNVDVETSEHEDSDVVVETRRAIKAGEQIYQESRDAFVQSSMEYYGTVPDYPRTWVLESSQIQAELVDLQKDEATGEIQFFWQDDDPYADALVLLFCIAHFERLVGLHDEVYNDLPSVDVPHERYAVQAFYEGLVDFYNATVLAIREMHAPQPVCQDKESCDDDQYDDLSEFTEHVDFSHISCSGEKEDMEFIDEFFSFYQNIEFVKYGHDTCLQMGNDIHECVTLRPHYHEFLVQYPARFLDDVKRVAIVGGGDSKILYESLKYPNLELVVHLELDQMVTRRSLKYFGTDPFYHDEKVEWWYADAGQSIMMLPPEYYGTFDLVVVDTTKEVIDFVPVAKNRTIMDATMLLVKPDGIISRNMDHEWGSNDPIARHMLDVYVPNLEIFCHNSFSYASENIDFFRKTPVDHGVETFLLKDVIDKSDDPYIYWHNYYKQNDVAESRCHQWAAENLRKAGTLMVLEAEKVSFDLESTDAVEAEVTKAIAEVGLTLKKMHRAMDGMSYFVLDEGYVFVQAWPAEKYCSFDIYLWSDLPKQIILKKTLVKALGSSDPSSFRMVTSGIYDGASSPPWEKEHCPHYDEATVDKPLDEASVKTILTESLSLVQKEMATLYILCGSKKKSCTMSDIVAKAARKSFVVPIWAPCDDDAQDLPACEAKLLDQLAELVETNGEVEGIFIDQNAPRTVGQVLYQIAAVPKNVRRFFSQNLVMVAPIWDGKAESWKMSLMDRFRASVYYVAPAIRTSLSFDGADKTLELGLFSAGDWNFFQHLTSFVTTVEKKTGLRGDVWSVKNGINRYIAEHEGTHSASHETYASKQNLDLFVSQKSLGTQYVSQYTKLPNLSLSAEMVTEGLTSVLSSVLVKKDLEDMVLYEATGTPEGFLIAAVWKTGHSFVYFNGINALTMNNVFLKDDNELSLHKDFAKELGLMLSMHESYPRGTNRVVNFAYDIEGGFIPEWAESLVESK